MSLVKTEKGKGALQKRDPSLSPRERQILVLCNGARSVSTLIELMGAAVEADVRRLMADAYLADQAVKPRRAPVAPAPVHWGTDAPLGPVAESVQQPASRRSRAATKMYIVDMLQLMRDMDASAMAVHVHTSASEAEFMANVVGAARLIARKSGASYGTRVVDKLREIAPEPFLPHLEALVDELDTVDS